MPARSVHAGLFGARRFEKPMLQIPKRAGQLAVANLVTPRDQFLYERAEYVRLEVQRLLDVERLRRSTVIFG